MTVLKRYFLMDILLQKVLSFWGKAKWLILLVRGAFVCLVSQIKYFLFWYDCARPTPKTKTFAESYSIKNCSEKYHKFRRKKTLMKSFLDKLHLVLFKEKLRQKYFLMTFAKFWRALLNSCFKETVNIKNWAERATIN